MKTLILSREFPPHVYGGAGVHVEHLVRELRALVDVEVRCFGDQDASGDGLAVRGYGPVDALLGAAPAGVRGALDAAARGVAVAGDPVDADVLHCHTWYSFMAGLLCKLLYGRPLVVTVHSLEPLRPWKRDQLGRGYDYSSWVERAALEAADAVIAVSRATAGDVRRLFAVPAERLVVVPNGIDVSEYRPDGGAEALAAHGIPGDLPYVLFVGRLTRQKGIGHLLRAARLLEPGLGLVLCAGAPDTEEIARETEAAVAGLQRTRRGVHWIREMVPLPELIQLYTRARAFCCPSIYEPFGLINLEAMACGTPVVAGAVGGIPEAVEDGVTGLLVPFETADEPPFGPRDPDAFARGLAAALNRLAGDPALRARMGAAARRRVEERFAWRAVAEGVVDVYRRVLSGEAPAGREGAPRD